MSPARPSLPPVLLVEPQFVLRRTLVSVAREMGLVEFHEATSMARALSALSTRRFQGIVLDLGDGGEGVELLAELRKGVLACDAETPVILMTTRPGARQDETLQAFRPVGVLQKPFKINELLQSMSSMAAHPPGAH
ncbi:response regulator [Xylophilus sp. Kf1]|nr:response regulator [Xylophilus sp. Kf1]